MHVLPDSLLSEILCLSAFKARFKRCLELDNLVNKDPPWTVPLLSPWFATDLQKLCSGLVSKRGTISGSLHKLSVQLFLYPSHSYLFCCCFWEEAFLLSTGHVEISSAHPSITANAHPSSGKARIFTKAAFLDGEEWKMPQSTFQVPDIWSFTSCI